MCILIRPLITYINFVPKKFITKMNIQSNDDEVDITLRN